MFNRVAFVLSDRGSLVSENLVTIQRASDGDFVVQQPTFPQTSVTGAIVFPPRSTARPDSWVNDLEIWDTLASTGGSAEDVFPGIFSKVNNGQAPNIDIFLDRTGVSSGQRVSIEDLADYLAIQSNAFGPSTFPVGEVWAIADGKRVLVWPVE